MPNAQISTNLKQIRADAGVSLTQAAAMTGVSKAMLGQIERGESSPTIATVWKLAKGFHLPLTAFVETPTGARRQIVFPESIRFQTIFAFDAVLGTESFLIELDAGQTHVSLAHDFGVREDILVTKGQIEVLTGKTWQPLKTGAALRFAADQQHGYRNLAREPAQFYCLHYYPR